MVNTKVFSTKTSSSRHARPADTTNRAGGKAYKLSDKGALAQYAMTGCFNGTYYSTAESQVKTLLELAAKVDATFLAKLAIYTRQQGLMKDTPAALAAVLANLNPRLLDQIFTKVIDNPKMVRNFVQILRSGAAGRKSLGTRPKKMVQKYLESLSDEQLFKADIGNNPSLPDIIKMVHPKPSNASRSALYAYLLGKEYNEEDLLKMAREFESFKKGLGEHLPNVPFQMLTALQLTEPHWKQIASHATWNQIRMNLNTFARHGVFSDKKIIASLAQKLADKEQVRSAKALPYQLFSAFMNVNAEVPAELKLALQDAADHALENIPAFNSKVYVMVDTSGSMSSPISGHRGTATSKMRCVDVAGLFASAILRKNPTAEIIPFDTSVHVNHKLNARDSIMTNAQTLANYGGGGTDCSSALAYVNKKKGEGDLVIYISDNESWCGPDMYRSTSTMAEWEYFKKRNPNAKLVNIDIQPSTTSQTHNRQDVLNIGGFSDNVFDVISKFVEVGNSNDLWSEMIEAVSL